MSSQALQRNVVLTTLVQVPALALGLVSGVFITRILGPHGRGVYAVFQADAELFCVLLGFSLNTAFAYFVASDKIPINRLLSIGVSALVVASLFVALIVVAAATPLTTVLFPPGYSSLAYRVYLAVAVILTLATGFLSAILRGRSDFVSVNAIMLGATIYAASAYAFLYAFRDDSPGTNPIPRVLGVSLSVLVFTAAVTLYRYARRVAIRPAIRGTSLVRDAMPLAAFAGIGYVSELVNLLNYRLDVWIVDYYRGPEELGLYALAVSAAQVFWLISNPIAAVLTPYVAGSSARMDLDLATTFAFYSRLNFTAVLVLIALSAFAAPYVIPLVYGSRFAGSVLPFVILLPGILASCATKVFALYVYVTGNIKYNLVATAIGTVVTVTLDLLLIPTHGIVGASLATTASYIVILGTVIYFAIVKLRPKGNYFILTPTDVRTILSRLKVFGVMQPGES